MNSQEKDCVIPTVLYHIRYGLLGDHAKLSHLAESWGRVANNGHLTGNGSGSQERSCHCRQGQGPHPW